jgi:hypothetical protein
VPDLRFLSSSAAPAVPASPLLTLASTQFMIHKRDRSEPRPHSEPAQQRASGENQNLGTLLVRGNNPPQSEGQNQARGTRRLRIPATRSINAAAYAEPAPAKPAVHQP